jgi:uncharacterized protein (TIGR00251 family)
MKREELDPVIYEKDGDAVIRCWIQPRASRNSITGVYNDSLKIALTAPPVDGKANKELCRFLSKELHIAKGAVNLVSGETSRNKAIRLSGISREQLLSKLT